MGFTKNKIFSHFELWLFVSVFFVVACSKNDDGTDPDPNSEPSITGTYCLDFSLVGSQLTITETGTEGEYTFSIQDFDGGLRSGTGSATLNGTTISATGTFEIEFGTADFEVELAYNENSETVSGEFVVRDPQDNALISSTINGTKGTCSFSLSPNDVDNIIGQQYLTAHHVEFAKIKKVSRYRSAAGHNFVDYSGESCVNLKHYFHTYREGEVGDGSQLPGSLDYFSPAAGTVVTIGKPRPSEDPTDYELDIQLDANENVIIRIFHVNLLNSIEVGTHLSAGQAIGEAPTTSLDAGDFAVYVLTDKGYRHISMFEIMSESLIDEYRARGVGQNWRQSLYYAAEDDYPNAITCENGNWGNLRHPTSRFELDFFILDD